MAVAAVGEVDTVTEVGTAASVEAIPPVQAATAGLNAVEVGQKGEVKAKGRSIHRTQL